MGHYPYDDSFNYPEEDYKSGGDGYDDGYGDDVPGEIHHTESHYNITNNYTGYGIGYVIFAFACGVIWGIFLTQSR